MCTPAGSIGALLPIQIKQGATFTLEIELTNDDGSPFNTGLYNARSHLRKKPFSDPRVAIAATFPTAGVLRLVLTSVETAALSCGSEIDSEASSYEWDCEFVAISDTTQIVPAFYGPAQVFRDI